MEYKMEKSMLFTISSLLLLLFVASCEVTPNIPTDGTRTTETTGVVSFNLRLVTNGSYYVGANPPDIKNVTLTSGYWIAETEVTYELWYEVNTWASSHGYTFANQGREGNDGTDGVAPTIARYEPVTGINWRDTMIWCNALSEKRGLTPVYYIDNAFTIPIRSVTNNSSLDTAVGHEDNPYVWWNANGYRLPTEAEWEIAARGGAVAETGGTYGTEYAGNNTIGIVAWYEANSSWSTQRVGLKIANELGLYDMSGNVFEWCWDWSGVYPSSATDPIGVTSGTARVLRGGGYFFIEDYCTVSYRTNMTPYNEWDDPGFRFVRKL